MSSTDTLSPEVFTETEQEDGLGFLDFATALAERWRFLVAGPTLCGLAALSISFFLPPIFTARTSFIPPQQQQSSAASALASLGTLAGLAGGSVKTPGDQYVALLQSVNIEDRIVDRFKLMDVYETKYRFAARKALERNVRIALGKKDGLITVEVDAMNPEAAADIANQYVGELRRLSSELALTEAQQRRVFFENEVKRIRLKLSEAQQALQSSGFNPDALKTEPKAAVESFAKIKAETTTAEVKLQTMRRTLADATPEIQQQQALLTALQAQLTKLEKSSEGQDMRADYIGRYREFKYQEALYELFSKQFEAARLDESREGGPLQVVDVATPPEHKSGPKRALLAISAAVIAGLMLSLLIVLRLLWSHSQANPANAEKLQRLRRAWRK